MPELATALDRILRIAAKPRPLSTLRSIVEQLDDATYDVTEEAIRSAVLQESWAGPVHRALQMALARWDHSPDSDWVAATAPNTHERRVVIYTLLEIGPELAATLDSKVPFYSDAEPIVVIAQDFEPWYTTERRAGATFFWDAYARYLESRSGWDPQGIVALDESTTAVVERISDPARDAVYQAKGLVVGYVQSGKTSNITGVIARAGDAGYRLVIVLSGTMNLLRAQTQRRIDRELIGKELIRPSDNAIDDDSLDYLLDDDWPMFIEHGGLPSALGAFDWIRLTGEVDDYQRLRAGIESLNFERLDGSKPLYHPDNLRRAKAKIMIVKKNAAILGRVAKDLRRITGRLADVPALVIDDESDLASINTKQPPTSGEEQQRTAINKRIVELLQQLPRAQYIGYTATPFANVFINPADGKDLFPKDFIISLPRPRGYMGARDFHDLNGPPPGADLDPYVSNQAAFVRDIRGPDTDPDNLLRAVDSFVLAGALKLYRQVALASEVTRRDPFRHHTMLVHSSRLVADQAAMAAVIAGVMSSAGYEAGAGVQRLRDLLTGDFAEVSASRGGDLPMPSYFDELHPYIGRALTLIWQGPSPVRIVNGEPGNDDPDFERQQVWKILVGGAKLSRGYTIEGLTVSYFRRTARAADTLMQMGRWFGFRDLYHDLVRVFIGRGEGRSGSVDLYEAFEGICRDEDAFRSELLRYAMPTDGGAPLTPMQVPPLVASHLDWVPPTAANKMFNARVQFVNFAGQWSEPTLAPEEHEDAKREFNATLLGQAIGTTTLATVDVKAGGQQFRAIAGVLPSDVVVRIARDYKWGNGHQSLTRELQFMTGTGAHDPEIHDWLLMAPQLLNPAADRIWPIDGHGFGVKFRSRVGSRVKAYSEPIHRAAAEAVIGAGEAMGWLESVRRPNRGVLLLYPATHNEHGPTIRPPTMGLAFLFPFNAIPSTIVFGVADPTRPHEPVVDAL